MTKNKIVVMLAVFLCLALLLPLGCAEDVVDDVDVDEPVDEENGEVEEEEEEEDVAEPVDIKVGVVGPLSGGAAAYGTNILNAIEIAVDEANQSGELGAVNLEVIAEDTQGDWAIAANAFSKLIDTDGVDVIIGGVLSSETEAGGPIAMDAGIPTISSASTAVDLTVGNPYLFRNCISDEVQAIQIAEYAGVEMGLGSFAVMYTNNDYGNSLKDAFEANAEQWGDIVAVESFMDGDDNFRPQLTSINEQNPDSLFIFGYYTEGGKIAQQAADLGMDVQLFGADGLSNDVYLEIGAEAVDGTVLTSAFFADDPDPVVSGFVDAYMQRHGEEPDMFAAQAYDAARIVIEAIKSHGVTSEDIRDGLEAIEDFPGITGLTTIDHEGDTIKDVLILQVEGDSFTRIR